MKKYIDIHTHTNYSDGELSPDELLKKAVENNIGTIAITDHDTINGIKSVDKNKYEYGLLISGGSDFHGKSIKPDIELGHGINDNLLIKKLSLVDTLKKQKH